ncbi:MAG: bifunctional nuclease domain-containing protein [Candidatus Binatia bacterium]
MNIRLWAVAFSVVFSLSVAPSPSVSGENDIVKVRVRKLVLDPSSKTPVVILESIDKKMFIPIWIGKAEATSIAMQIEHVEIPRPNTHDLIRNMLEGLGAEFTRVTITDLRNNTYFAVVTLKLNDQEFQIDSRPSDAIAVALRMKAPIYASPEVLSKADKLPTPREENEGVRKILGFHIQDLTANLASLFHLQNKEGVLVADVDAESAASKAGFRRGDVIIRINDESVLNVHQLESYLKGVEKPVHVEFHLEREGKPATIGLDLPL